MNGDWRKNSFSQHPTKYFESLKFLGSVKIEYLIAYNSMIIEAVCFIFDISNSLKY